MDAVAALLGPRAHEALGRSETTPALRRTGHPDAAGSPIATLTRLFLLQASVPAGQAVEGVRVVGGAWGGRSVGGRPRRPVRRGRPGRLGAVPQASLISQRTWPLVTVA